MEFLGYVVRAFSADFEMLVNDDEIQLNAGVINLKLKHKINPNIPYKVIEILNKQSKPTNKPAEITEPGMAYPEDDKEIRGLRNFAFLQLNDKDIAKKTVNIAADIPINIELINISKLPQKFDPISLKCHTIN